MAWHSGLEHCIRESEPLAAHCWLGLGGPAKFFCEPTNQDELISLVQRCREESLSIRLIGSGSNILVPDEGFDGLVVSLPAAEFGRITVDGTTVTAGGAALLSHTIMTAAREGLAGMEGLVGIPGTIGGALHGNAGDRTSDIGNPTESVTVLTRNGELLTRSRNEMNFSYRQSSLDELAIVESRFQLEPEDREELVRRIQKMWIVKSAVQPSRERRTACLFKDPMGATANEIIDQAGLKGATENAAALFDRDANFVIARDAVTSADVRRLIDTIQQQVREKLGVELETAIQFW
jgi:UDP-N-acetylmuramate dehydrogenase